MYRNVGICVVDFNYKNYAAHINIWISKCYSEHKLHRALLNKRNQGKYTNIGFLVCSPISCFFIQNRR